jgi:hypothetical protein
MSSGVKRCTHRYTVMCSRRSRVRPAAPRHRDKTARTPDTARHLRDHLPRKPITSRSGRQTGQAHKLSLRPPGHRNATVPLRRASDGWPVILRDSRFGSGSPSQENEDGSCRSVGDVRMRHAGAVATRCKSCGGRSRPSSELSHRFVRGIVPAIGRSGQRSIPCPETSFDCWASVSRCDVAGRGVVAVGAGTVGVSVPCRGALTSVARCCTGTAVCSCS